MHDNAPMPSLCCSTSRGLCLAPLLLVVVTLTAVADEPPQPLWTITECAGAPSHVLYDPDSNRLLVSQISGAGDAKDGDGVISRMTLEGDVEQCAWVSGLNAPKGLARRGDSLWVSDIDELCEISVADAQVIRRLPCDGARFLVGVSIAPDGTVYAADLLTSSIFRVEGDACRRCVFGPDLESPAGLLAGNKQLVIAGWGYTDDFTTETPGRCLTVSLASQEMQPLSSKPLGNLYGLAADGEQGWFLTDWSSGGVFHVGRNEQPHKVLQLAPGAAGIAYVPEQRVLIVAELKENRISAFELPDLRKDGQP